MIKVEVIGGFTLEDYKKLKNVKKVTNRKENEFGVKDTFECDEKMVDYLTGNNALNKVVVKVVEVKKIENIDETIEKIKESAKETVKLNELGNPIDTREFKEEKPKKKKKTSKK